MKILFTPVGLTDPMKKYLDGPMLHICRHTIPDLCCIVFTRTTFQQEQKDHRYTRAIQLLYEHLGKPAPVIEMLNTDVENPDIADDVFYSSFERKIQAMHESYPQAQIICNISSGTPSIKNSLEMLHHFLPFSTTVCYVRNSSQNAAQDVKDGMTEKNGNEYDVDTEWLRNKDNQPNSANRLIVNPPSKLTPVMMRLTTREVIKMVDRSEYMAALRMAEDSLVELPNQDELKLVLNGCVCRMQLDLTAAGKNFIKTGLKKTGQRLIDHADNSLWRCAEMLLTMEQDLLRKDYGSFLRKLTPVMYKLTQELALKKHLPFTEWMNSSGKFIPDKVPNDLRAILCINDRPTFSSTENLLSALECRKLHSQSAVVLRDLRDKVESNARNCAAHDLPSINEKWFIEKTGKRPEQVQNALWNVLKELDETVYGEYRKNSYKESQDYIHKLLGV